MKKLRLHVKAARFWWLLLEPLDREFYAFWALVGVLYAAGALSTGWQIVM